MFSLIPREQVFFDLLEHSAATVHDGATKIAEMFTVFDRLDERAKAIKDVEHEGDRLTHEMIERLNKTFVTPLDREDLHALACRLDDILDHIDTAATRAVLYKLDKTSEDARALAVCIERATSVIKDAIPRLRRLSSRSTTEALLKSCIDLHTLENEGDRIEQHALARLFEDKLEPLEVIKWKDIYTDLEAATDSAEDVANCIESIVLKNA
jgi:predicted phosphate transport protein (TIGR00153 family)